MKVLGWISALFHRGLVILGLATLVSLCWFYGVIWYEGGPSPVMAAPASVPVSPVASRAAALISPDLQEIARRSEDAIVAGAGGAVSQWAARKVYPLGVERIPDVAELGCDHLLTRFGDMPVGEIAAWLVDHAASKGLKPPHWSVRAAAEQEGR